MARPQTADSRLSAWRSSVAKAAIQESGCTCRMFGYLYPTYILGDARNKAMRLPTPMSLALSIPLQPAGALFDELR
jgi:hypothetical protein